MRVYRRRGRSGREPLHKGPCEHGVKQRSKCKVCSACPHGRRRYRVQGVRWGINLRARSSALSSARSAVGQESASTVVSAISARSAVGQAICEHGRLRSKCKECGGACILRARSSALSVQGVRWGVNLRARSSALLMQGVRWVTICEHGRRRSQCKECGGSCILRARSSALSVQGVRWVRNMRARSSALISARSVVRCNY